MHKKKFVWPEVIECSNDILQQALYREWSNFNRKT